MNLRGACHHAARLRSPRIAFRIGNNASSGLNLQCSRGVIPWVRREVNRAIEHALRDEGIIKPHRTGHSRAQSGLAQLVENFGGQVGRAAYVTARLIKTHRIVPSAEASGRPTYRAQWGAIAGDQTAPQEREVRYRGNGRTLMNKRHQDAGHGVSGRVVCGAIDRIYHPHGIEHAAA